MMEELNTDLYGFISLKEFASFCKSDGNTAEATRNDGGLAGLKNAFELYDQDKKGQCKYNHSTAEHLEEHSFAGRLFEEETSLLVDMSKSMVQHYIETKGYV
ncbi:hypothetical protein ACSBR2_018021 [Camellia fascicularis]